MISSDIILYRYLVLKLIPRKQSTKSLRVLSTKIKKLLQSK